MNPIDLIEELETSEMEDFNPHGMNGTGNNDNSHTLGG